MDTYLKQPVHKIPVKRAIIFLLLSLVLTTFIFFATRFFLCYLTERNENDPRYSIKVLAQSCTTDEPLRFAHLAEMLELSIDKPINLYAVRKQDLEKRLLSYPIVQSASVRFIEPCIVYVDYSLRKPVAMLADFENVGIDAEGHLFHIVPFITPKKLPEIYFGNLWGSNERKMLLERAFDLLECIQKKEYSTAAMHVSYIDMQKAQATTADREIILELIGKRKYLLRLQSEGYEDGLNRFFTLIQHRMEALLAKEVIKPPSVIPWDDTEQIVVDLRLPKLAYIGVHR